VLHLLVVIHLRASMRHIMAKSIEKIPMVQEFPYVFLDNLPGMPPEGDIEFKIEL
jgi:hypothetical protein